MDHRDEWFSPESVEEQIEQSLSDPDQSSPNTRLLQDLQQLTEADVHRLARIRERLLEHRTSGVGREPVPIQRYQQPHIQPLAQPEPPLRTQKQSRFLGNLLSGLVAVLVIGSMLAAFTWLRPQPQVTSLKLQPPAPASFIHGTAAYLLDATSGKVLFDSNSHARMHITSTVKIMTAVVAIENANLDQPVTIQKAMLDQIPPGASVAHLQVGDQFQLRDLLYGLLLSSGDDAALAIAQTVAGDTQKFVAMMNEEAHQLQLNDTHFTSPYGSVDPDNYSNAADLTHLGWYAMQLSDFAQIVAQEEYTLPATREHHFYLWPSTNPLLTTYAGMNGIKLSYDGNMGSMIFSAQRNGHLLVGTEWGTRSIDLLVSDVKMLLDRGFASIPPDPTPTPPPPTLGSSVRDMRG